MTPITNGNLEHKAANWQRCDVNRLTGYFHRFEYNKAQFERLGYLHLSEQNIKALFTEKGSISSFQICLGADSETASTDYFTFRPVLCVKYDDGTGLEVEFDHYQPKVGKNSSGRVPAEFSNWLTKNWQELDVSLVDDAFTAFMIADGTSAKVKKRLMGYCFNGSTNEKFLKFIRDHQYQLTSFIFHLGVDMNKSGHKDLFGFSPIFELTLEPTNNKDERLKRFEAIHQAGLRTIFVEEGDEPILYEYSSPCPSSC